MHDSAVRLLGLVAAIRASLPVVHVPVTRYGKCESRANSLDLPTTAFIRPNHTMLVAVGARDLAISHQDDAGICDDSVRESHFRARPFSPTGEGHLRVSNENPGPRLRLVTMDAAVQSLQELVRCFPDGAIQ